MYKLVFLLTVLVFEGSHGETSLGNCPNIEPVSGFNMNRFLGYWYAIQTTDNASPCLSYHIAKDAQHEGQYQITEIEQHTTMWSSVLHHEHNLTGELTVPDPTHPGRMALDLPFDIGTSTFTVFMTDYGTYAAIFTCKKYPVMHRWSAKILSRSHTLDMAFVDKVRTRLSSYNIDPFNLKIVSQKLCPKAGTQGSLVKTASGVVTGVRNTVSNVVGDVQDTVQGLISDPSIKNAAEQSRNVPAFLDVRNNDHTSGNIGQTISNAASNFGEKVSGVISNVGEQTAGAISSVRDGASKVVGNVEEKFNSFTSQESFDALGVKISDAVSNVGEKISSITSQENVGALGAKISDAVSDVGERVNSINKHRK